MLKFVFAVLITATLLAVSLAVGVYVGWVHHYPSFSTPTLLFLSFATLMLYRYLLRATPSHFVQMYLLTMAIKLLAFAAYCLVIILKDRAGAAANIVFFLVAYGAFTAVEIIFLYRRVNR